MWPAQQGQRPTPPEPVPCPLCCPAKGRFFPRASRLLAEFKAAVILPLTAPGPRWSGAGQREQVDRVLWALAFSPGAVQAPQTSPRQHRTSYVVLSLTNPEPLLFSQSEAALCPPPARSLPSRASTSRQLQLCTLSAGHPGSLSASLLTPDLRAAPREGARRGG